MQKLIDAKVVFERRRSEAQMERWLEQCRESEKAILSDPLPYLHLLAEEILHLKNSMSEIKGSVEELLYLNDDDNHKAAAKLIKLLKYIDKVNDDKPS